MRLSCTFYDLQGKELGKKGDGEAVHSFEKISLCIILCVLKFISLCLAWQVMNEVALHRGRSPHLDTIDVFVDGQHLTECVVRKNISSP